MYMYVRENIINFAFAATGMYTYGAKNTGEKSLFVLNNGRILCVYVCLAGESFFVPTHVYCVYVLHFKDD